MRYHLFQKFFGKMVKIKEMSFLSTRGMTLMFGNCIVPHLKDLIHICLEPEAQGKIMTFIVIFIRSKYPQIIA